MNQPFPERVRLELDAMERRIFVRSALATFAGGLVALALALIAWVVL